MTSISTSSLMAAPRAAVLQAQASLSKAQVELSSGKLADIGLGLGSTTGTYVSFGVDVRRLQAIKASNATTAATLNAATTGMESMRATASAFLSSLTEAVSAGNTSGTLVAAAGANLDALLSSLNATVGGRAVFAGLDTAKQPMTAYTVAAPGQTESPQAAVDDSFSSHFGGRKPGDASASSISGDDMRSYLASDGAFADLFGDAQYQGTWSSATPAAAGSAAPVPTARISTTETVATSVSANDAPFRQLAQAYAMVKEFGGSNFGPDAGQAVIASATKLVSAAMAGLTDAEAGVGQSQAAVSAADDRMDAQISYLTSSSDDLVGVDATALATRIAGLNTQIQASYEVTAQLQQLSLVDYLK